MLPPKEPARKQSLAPQNHLDESRSSDYSNYEKTVLILSFLMIIMMLIFAAWSGVLLLAGTVKGGGPVGMIMNLLPLHLLLD